MNSFRIEQNTASPQKEFVHSLYQENLQEVSFLYEQRLGLLDDPEISWRRIEDFEGRLEAQIDGLVVGGELALEVCGRLASEGDCGELHAAVNVFCRQSRKDLVMKVLEKVDPEDSERTQAISDALNYELPDPWVNDFVQMLPECQPKNIPIIAKLIGYRRLPAGKELLEILPGKNSEGLSGILWALGRLSYQEAHHLLLTKYLPHQDETMCFFAALALLRMGEAEALNHCMRSANSQNWPISLLGLGGDRSTVSLLVEKSSQDKAGSNCLLSLGLLGDISAVETLLARFVDPKLAETSALALNLITGAEIYEQVFIPEEIDEDELFEEDREGFKQGKVPTRPDGTPYGTRITRLSQKPDDWNQWWSKNSSQFNPNIRYRNGKPYSPACLLEDLESEKSPRRIRQLAYEELVIRYGVDFPFETDMFVAQQKKAMSKYAEWVKGNSNRFRDGEWYFAGQPMS